MDFTQHQQGALLSLFIRPIYWKSITVGSKFHPGHMKRALYERIQEHVGDLPESFRLNIPQLFATTSPETRQVPSSLLKPPLFPNGLIPVTREVPFLKKIVAYQWFWLQTLNRFPNSGFMSWGLFYRPSCLFQCRQNSF